MRRLRAALFIAIVWAIVWAFVGVLVAVLYGRPRDFEYWLFGGASWAVLGLINGSLFSLVLAILERSGTVESISYGRIMLWGALGSLVVPVLATVGGIITFGMAGMWSAVAVPIATAVSVGAVCAATTLRIARLVPSRGSLTRA